MLTGQAVVVLVFFCSFASATAICRVWQTSILLKVWTIFPAHQFQRESALRPCPEDPAGDSGCTPLAHARKECPDF
jgi:hypothetical protein